jgi:hypothetical protein
MSSLKNVPGLKSEDLIEETDLNAPDLKAGGLSRPVPCRLTVCGLLCNKYYVQIKYKQKPVTNILSRLAAPADDWHC